MKSKHRSAAIHVETGKEFELEYKILEILKFEQTKTNPCCIIVKLVLKIMVLVACAVYIYVGIGFSFANVIIMETDTTESISAALDIRKSFDESTPKSTHCKPISTIIYTHYQQLFIHQYQIFIYLPEKRVLLPAGAENISNLLRDYRDGTSLVHDQTVPFLNKGLYPEEIIPLIHMNMPTRLKEYPYLQEFYGTIDWSVRGIFDSYLGWFSGDAADLYPLSKIKSAKYLLVNILICNHLKGPKYKAANENNVPIVNFLWLIACLVRQRNHEQNFQEISCLIRQRNHIRNFWN